MLVSNTSGVVALYKDGQNESFPTVKMKKLNLPGGGLQYWPLIQPSLFQVEFEPILKVHLILGISYHSDLNSSSTCSAQLSFNLLFNTTKMG